MTATFGTPRIFTDAEIEAQKASRVMCPIKYTIVLPPRTFWVIAPGAFLRDARGYVVTSEVETLAASEDADALRAAARLLSGQAAYLRGDDPPPEYLGNWVDAPLDELLKGTHT